MSGEVLAHVVTWTRDFAHSAHEWAGILNTLVKHREVEGSRQECGRVQRTAKQPKNGRPRPQQSWRHNGVALGNHEIHQTSDEQDEADHEEGNGLFLTPAVVTRAGESDD